MAGRARDALQFAASDRAVVEAYLPSRTPDVVSKLPITTLTFATSLDSMLSLRPGAPTALSGPQSKAMTHYLRSRHQGILIGVGTAVADDPSLNCRLEGVGGYGGQGLQGQPRPLIIDPSARWCFSESSKVLQLAASGRGRAPYIFTANESPPAERRTLLEQYGGRYIQMKMLSDGKKQSIDWKVLLAAIRGEGITSVMVEGGARVINSLLAPEYQDVINSVIVTIAPTWLGRGGVLVSPDDRHDELGRPIAVAKLADVKWHPLGEDVVMCGSFTKQV